MLYIIKQIAIHIISKGMETPKKATKATEIAKKILEDKEFIKAYLKGEISKEKLDERGIKLSMPL